MAKKIKINLMQKCRDHRKEEQNMNEWSKELFNE